MKIYFKKYLLLILALCCCLLVQAQQKDKATYAPKKERYQSPLNQARAIKTSDPELAIKLLESILRKGKKGANDETKAEAYILLGNIYEDIDQTKLALQRYQQAKRLLDKLKRPELIASNHYYIGQLYLKLANYKEARQNLNTALRTTQLATLQLQCKEALADLSIQSGNLEEGLRLYNDLLISSKNSRPLDSLTYARIEAKKARIFLQQNNRAQAEQSYLNSISRVNNKTQQVSKKDYELIEQTNQALQTDDVADSVKINLSRNSLEAQKRQDFPKELQIKENLQLADLYADRGEVETAESYVTASEDLINDAVSPIQKAAVFKKASELKSRKGEYELALVEFKKYVAANELVFQQKQKILNQQISILETQKNIDLLEKDYEVAEKDDALFRNQVQFQQLIIGFLSLLLLAAIAAFYFIMKNVKARRKANQLLYLKSLRNQMNPHFIFNALNSVNNFIAKNDERAANKFLTDFSRLMRMVLDYSQKDFVAFEEEIQLIELYVKLEHLRFRDKFDYTIEKDPAINALDVDIPPMLIQPFIENAIWHGLRYKKDKGQLLFSIRQKESAILISIQDNGIGRAKSKAIKTKNQQKYKSTGLENVQKRIALINEIYGKNYRLSINDLVSDAEDSGTIVEIRIPLN